MGAHRMVLSLGSTMANIAVSIHSGQYSAQYDSRVDGRASHNEGLPPSAADKGNGRFDNPIYPEDCAEVDSLKPDARPGWQARVRNACQ